MVIPAIRWPLVTGLIVTLLTYTLGAPSTSFETSNELNNAIAEELIGDNMVANEDHGFDEDLAEEIAAEKDKIAIQALQSYARDKILSAKSQKRLSSGFYGSRGKKEALPSGFFGARGKKATPPQSFFGARGKRLVRSTQNGRDLYYANGKRIDPNSFFGMRGKRTQEESYPLLVQQQQYYRTIPQQSLTGDEEHYFYDSNDDNVDRLGYYLNSFEGDNNNSIAEEIGDKEKLLALVDYYLSLRNQRNSAYKSSKVKRQPPNGFHAIRGR